MSQIKRYLDKTGLEHLVELLKQYPTNTVLNNLINDLQTQVDTKVSTEDINDTITQLVANAGDNIFWVEYGVTTKQQINAALRNNRFPVLVEKNENRGDVYAPLAETNWTYITFMCYMGGTYYTYRLQLDNNQWSVSTSNLQLVQYKQQSLTAAQKAQARANIGAISAADVPGLVADYLNSLDGDGLEY